jgi:hypothetical protein
MLEKFDEFIEHYLELVSVIGKYIPYIIFIPVMIITSPFALIGWTVGKIREQRETVLHDDV